MSPRSQGRHRQQLGRTTPGRIRELVERSRGDGDLVVVDGLKPVRELLGQFRNWETLLVQDDLDPADRSSLQELAGEHPLEVVSEPLLQALADSRTGRGAALLMPRPLPPATPVPGRPLLVLDGLQDPGNLGAIVRVAEAAAVGGVLTTPGSCRAFSPRAVRASAGSLLRVPVWDRCEEFPPPPTSHRWSMVALDPSARLRLDTTVLSGDLAMIIGSEGQGLSGRFPSAQPRSLPMAGQLSSLSVLSATSVALWILTGFAAGGQSLSPKASDSKA